ncbi:hypothetical protein CRUP_002543 [Coryphaenoides rupestris]|nr:hypothetical protein CRUP_002543 [Coryphaenoides rupestris]
MVKFLQVEARGCDFVVLWLDCDKEGENICFEVLDAIEPVMNKPSGREQTVYRAKFSSITDTDIWKAMSQLGAPDRNQALAVDARQELDLRIGCAFTRSAASATLLALCYTRSAAGATPLALCYTRSAASATPLALCYTRSAAGATPLALCYTRSAASATPLALCYTRSAARATPLALCYTRSAARATPLALCYTRSAARHTASPMLHQVCC